MIPKDTTTTVNFYVADTDGLPATGKASSIAASISIDGGNATAISATISEIDSTNLPGWYRFTYTFSTAGNILITFVASDCIIMPWEEQVIEISASSAPSATDVATAVWNASSRTITNTIPSATDIASEVWYIAAFNISGTDVPYGDVVKATYTAMDGISGMVADVKLKTDRLPYDPAAVGSAMTLTAAYDAAKTASQLTTADIPAASSIATAVWSDTTIYTGNSKGNRLSGIYNTAQNIPGMVWMVSADYGDGIQNTMGQAIYNLFNNHATATNITNAQTAIIAAMPDIGGLSTFNAETDKVTLNTTEDGTLTAIKNKVDTLQNTDISTLAKSSELTGLSTFNVSTDKVTLNTTEDSTLSAIKTKVDSLTNTDISSLATKTDLNNAQTAIIGAIPTVPTDYAKEGDTMALSAADIASIKNGLATGSNVSDAQSAIINAMPDISGLSTFNPATDSVQLDSTQLTSLATGSEITDAKNDIITALADIDIDTSELAKATDVAVVADMLKQLDSGVLHWSTTATTLTLFNDDNTVMKTYSLQRDIQGNIVRIDPNV